MTPRNRRMVWIVILIIAVSLATFLILRALRENINFFFKPLQIARQEAPMNVKIRVGGMVKKGTVKRFDDLGVQFIITDFSSDLKISYKGILPDLFREGQGVVALGKIDPVNQNHFIADEILAKHDEKYMPPEIADLKGEK